MVKTSLKHLSQGQNMKGGAGGGGCLGGAVQAKVNTTQVAFCFCNICTSLCKKIRQQ